MINVKNTLQGTLFGSSQYEGESPISDIFEDF